MKIEFNEIDAKNVEVLVDGDTYGTLKFGNEEFGTKKNIWILWLKYTDDGVSYFEDLEETEETIKDEIVAFYNEN